MLLGVSKPLSTVKVFVSLYFVNPCKAGSWLLVNDPLDKGPNCVSFFINIVNLELSLNCFIVSILVVSGNKLLSI